jgi:hypothetical protein
METNPFSGDIKYLQGQERLRRRVGNGASSSGWNAPRIHCTSLQSSAALRLRTSSAYQRHSSSPSRLANEDITEMERVKIAMKGGVVFRDDLK